MIIGGLYGIVDFIDESKVVIKIGENICFMFDCCVIREVFVVE